MIIVSGMESIQTRPGWQIARLLKRAGKTQHALARECGVSQAALNNVIHRKAGGMGAEKKARIWEAIAEAVAKKETA